MHDHIIVKKSLTELLYLALYTMLYIEVLPFSLLGLWPVVSLGSHFVHLLHRQKETASERM